MALILFAPKLYYVYEDRIEAISDSAKATKYRNSAGSGFASGAPLSQGDGGNGIRSSGVQIQSGMDPASPKANTRRMTATATQSPQAPGSSRRFTSTRPMQFEMP